MEIDRLFKAAMESIRSAKADPRLPDAEIQRDIRVWLDMIRHRENSDGGVPRQETVSRLEDLAKTSRRFRKLLRPPAASPAAAEARAWLLGAFVSTRGGVVDAEAALQSALDAVAVLEDLSTVAASKAHLDRGRKADDGWNSSENRIEALMLLISIWADWTGRDRLGERFKYMAQLFMETGYGGNANFDRLYKEARKRKRARPDGFRVFWRESEWQLGT